MAVSVRIRASSMVVEHGGSGSDVAGSVAAQLLEQAQS